MREQTICISVHNGINYLPLVVKSVRENSYDKDCPFVIYSENSDDGTNEWLEENKEKIPEAESKETNELLEDVKKQLEDASIDVTKLQELNKTLMDQIQKLAPHMQAEQENVTPDNEESPIQNEEDVVDADFEVVDEEAKESSK